MNFIFFKFYFFLKFLFVREKEREEVQAGRAA